ncbi:YcxB family protein [Chloroflexales bacterium ZM16-3]|nr:YcxB family protein [Chloroflexales bacterium ZM16-3]
MIVVEARLQPPQFFQLSLLRHFQRPSFYFYAVTAAALTALTYTMNIDIMLLVVGWVPFGIYMILGLANAFAGSRNPEQPYFLQTRYEFGDEELRMSTSRGASTLIWSRFKEWRKVVGCYVLVLDSGPIMAIPVADVPKGRQSALEDFLKKKIPL